MKRLPRFLLIGLVFLSLRCGYTTHSAIIAQYRTIDVEPVKNDIDFTQENRRSFYFPLLEVKIKDALVDRFLFDGNLKVAAADTADLVIHVTLIDYSRGALRYDDDDDVEEYRVQILAHMVLEDVRTQKVLWKGRIVGESTYFIRGTLATSESSAVDEAVKDLARRIVEQAVELW